MVDFKNMQPGDRFFVNNCDFANVFDMWVDSYIPVVFLGFEKGSNKKRIRVVQPQEENFVMTVNVEAIANVACLEVIPFDSFELCPVCGQTVLASDGTCVNIDNCKKAQEDDEAHEKEKRRKEYEELAKEFGA